MAENSSHLTAPTAIPKYPVELPHDCATMLNYIIETIDYWYTGWSRKLLNSTGNKGLNSLPSTIPTLNIEFNVWSNVRSDTARLSRWFSFSSAFSRFNWSAFSPPYSLRQRQKRHLDHPDLADRISHRHPLAEKNIKLTPFRNNLLRLLYLLRHNGPPS